MFASTLGLLCIESTRVHSSYTLPVGLLRGRERSRMISVPFRMPEKVVKREPHRKPCWRAMPSSDLWFNDALFLVISLNFACNIVLFLFVLSDQGNHLSLYVTVTST